MNWRRVLPILDIDIRIPLISVKTSLLTDCIECDWFRIIMLEVKVWKWKCGFELYRTGEHQKHRKKFKLVRYSGVKSIMPNVPNIPVVPPIPPKMKKI